MPGFECEQERDHRVPRLGPPGVHEVAAHLTDEARQGRFLRAPILFRRRAGGWIEDADVASQAGHDQASVDARDDARGKCLVGLDEGLEPFAEADDVEPIVAGRRGAAPQVEVQNGGHLCGRCRRQQLASGVEPAVANELMECLGWQVRHDLRQVSGVEQAHQLVVRRPGAVAIRSRHGGQRIAPSVQEKQS